MKLGAPYQERSKDFEIHVAPLYLPDQSDPQKALFVYFYAIRITNHGEQPGTLLTRHWRIRDGKGREEIVEGDGVVGEQPTIYPGQSYAYTSYCPLKTPTGNMRGHYTIKLEDGVRVEINIPLFFLRPEDQLGEPNGLYASLEGQSAKAT